MCPDPALLVAYLDGTLFHRDATAVDQHVSSCASCASLLAAMRVAREAEQQGLRSSRRWTIGAAITAIAITGIGIWAVRSGPKSQTRSEITTARSEPARALAPASVGTAASPTVPEGSNAPGARAPAPPKPPTTPEKASRATDKPSRDAVRPSKGAPDEAGAKPPAVRGATGPDLVANPATADAGVILRGRNANRRILWRTRDRVIEHSTDGGATWVAEHTADRRIRAGAFVDANVAWIVGENGLILRRTRNGWFGASPPADGHINAVRASSPSKATITLEDGRVFSTENGGVTWSTP